MNCRTQGFLVLHYLPESAQTRVHWVSDSIQPPHPLLPPFPPALNLLNFRVFSNELVLCIRWPNISASASVLPMNIQDWFLLRLAGLISLLQGTPWHHNLKSSVLQYPAFFLWPNSLFFSCRRKLCTHYQSLHNSSQPYLRSPGSHQSIFYLHGLYPGSVQFSHSVVSDSLQPHGLQHTRLPCLSPAPRGCSNSRPSSWWCHPTISSAAIPFSSCLQSFQHQGLPMSQLFTSGGQSIEASASVLPVNIQDWFWILHINIIIQYVSLWLASFTSIMFYYVLNVHPCYSMYQFLFSFHLNLFLKSLSNGLSKMITCAAIWKITPTPQK